MSKLETRTQPILAPMMNGQEVQLSIEQQLVVVQWLVKTSMAYEFLGSAKRPKFFLPSERHDFMQSLSVPPGILAFLASYTGRHDVYSRETRPAFMLEGQNLHSNLAGGHKVKGYSVTLAIKHLALQLIALRWPERSPAPKDYIIRIRGEWRDAELRVWPTINKSLNWPPQSNLDDVSFDLFINRWRAE